MRRADGTGVVTVRVADASGLAAADAAAAGADEVLANWGRIDIVVNNAVKSDSAGVLVLAADPAAHHAGGMRTWGR